MCCKFCETLIKEFPGISCRLLGLWRMALYRRFGAYSTSTTSVKVRKRFLLSLYTHILNAVTLVIDKKSWITEYFTSIPTFFFSLLILNPSGHWKKSLHQFQGFQSSLSFDVTKISALTCLDSLCRLLKMSIFNSIYCWIITSIGLLCCFM